MKKRGSCGTFPINDSDAMGPPHVLYTNILINLVSCYGEILTTILNHAKQFKKNVLNVQLFVQ